MRWPKDTWYTRAYVGNLDGADSRRSLEAGPELGEDLLGCGLGPVRLPQPRLRQQPLDVGPLD